MHLIHRGREEDTPLQCKNVDQQNISRIVQIKALNVLGFSTSKYRYNVHVYFIIMKHSIFDQKMNSIFDAIR